MIEIYQKEGLKGFFSGGLTSCIKEGFFAGLYYMLYNELKVLGLNKATAGISAGMLATAVTHPFELIRARLQTMGLHKQPIDKVEKHIIWS
jgi:solute carrier family 25 protein 38